MQGFFTILLIISEEIFRTASLDAHVRFCQYSIHALFIFRLIRVILRTQEFCMTTMILASDSRADSQPPQGLSAFPTTRSRSRTILKDPSQYPALLRYYRERASARERQRILQLVANGYHGLVHSMAKRFLHRGLAYDDLTQEGFIGLMRAAELYDETRGTSLLTYASYWIRAKMERAVEDQGIHNAYYVPASMQQIHRHIIQARTRFQTEYGRLPNEIEILTRIREKPSKFAQNIKLADVREGLRFLERREFSLQEPVRAQGELIPRHFSDVIPSHAALTPENVLDARETLEVCQRTVDRLFAAMARISERNASIVRERLVLDPRDQPTLEVVGKRHGITREAARQAELRTLEKIERRFKMRREDILSLLQTIDELSKLLRT